MEPGLQSAHHAEVHRRVAGREAAATRIGVALHAAAARHSNRGEGSRLVSESASAASVLGRAARRRCTGGAGSRHRRGVGTFGDTKREPSLHGAPDARADQGGNATRGIAQGRCERRVGRIRSLHSGPFLSLPEPARLRRIHLHQAVAISLPSGMTHLLVLAIAYLTGGIPFGYLLVKLKTGEDVRCKGSVNLGATNVLRTTGRAIAVVTLLLDIGKGFFAVWLAAKLTHDSAGWTSAAALAVSARDTDPMLP